jgi:hypothetical protein
MKWNAVLALVAVLLLVLPLGLILFWRNWGPTEVEGWRFAPELSSREARRLPSLLQPCQSDVQCDPPLVCFHDPRSQRQVCTGSGCNSDSQCPPWTVCRAIPVKGQRLALRGCAFVGEREEGESCLRYAPFRQARWACEPGLVCAGAGWCGRRCGPGTDGSCPEGFFCARGDPEGPVCQPTCEGRACPEGQECVRQPGGVSVCARVQGNLCHQEPCSAGEVCEMEVYVTEVERAWRWCYPRCGGDGDAACPERFVCYQGQCRVRCSTADPESCRKSEFCVSTEGSVNGACMFRPEPWNVGTEPAREGG